MGGYDWTISHNSGTSSYAFRVDIAGSVAYDYGSAVRPSFYLNSVVQYSSGIGTESDPIRLVVDSSDSPPNEPSEPTTPTSPTEPTDPVPSGPPTGESPSWDDI